MSKKDELLKEIGLSESQIKELENPDTDIEVIISEWRKTNIELLKAKEGLITQEDLSGQTRTQRKGLIKKFAKAAGIELTDSKANEIAGMENGTNEFITLAETHINQKIKEAATGTDEELKQRLNDLTIEKVNLAAKIDEITSSYETKITETNQSWEQKYNQKDVESLLDKGLSKIDFADKTRVDVDSYYIINKMKELGYKVNPGDGSITREDGKPPVSLDGKSIYKNIFSENRSENPLLDIAYEKKLISVSNGGVGSGTPDPTKKVIPTKDGEMPITGKAAELAAQFAKK